MVREALLYEKEPESRTRCGLCSHRCLIGPGTRGICGVRENREGTLFSLVYGALVAENVDPIEKKPLFHFLPGSRSYSIATVGCNFRCAFCQNHEISQTPRERDRVAGQPGTPAQVVENALECGAKSISYTFTEPTVYFEFALDTARIARAKGLRNVFVTNGYMTGEMLQLIAPLLDAANVDLKAFSDEFYRKLCGGTLGPVLESLRMMKDLGIWVEVTTLLIPHFNDSEAEIRQIAAFVASLGTETPWHIGRFFPRYRMATEPPTPAAAILEAAQIGHTSGLKYVYGGNIPGDTGENTFCFHCGHLLIGRYGFSVKRLDLEKSACPHCGTPLEGIF